MGRPSYINEDRLKQFSGVDHTITVEEAASILNMKVIEAAKLMSRWVKQGVFKRVRRGLYIHAQYYRRSSDHPWVIAAKIFSPCYIGALSAAEYWGLTQQKAPHIYILMTKQVQGRYADINHVSYFKRRVPEETMFGLSSTMRDGVEVMISDPSRTIINFLTDPELGGGIVNIIEIFTRYLNSPHSNANQLFEYARQLANGAVLKRLGYLLERCKSGEFNIIKFCKLLKTTGNNKLDPALSADKLITRWNLLVPDSWEK